ncbi:hypothetical protein, unlikely [Trypanosoma brucei gambiense DAL972]|uniref:Uncharacterized protein n=1 Tax=Trypanosoma brucei gambiense (strain MHOM/CI/86/DAL972) TaxID=679716 RepID=C9ZQ07_TRYB9|nr:hypothetical protein, unlikely [Trypanosoma brucei gambiense DAL972]CBH11485.1 hypothetical protein, unlikely [Trypanosoma brucei gambiense DAL972]|eukprot:XP_011773772.1 hypothetical protein, unlikely [Trypanosoma brucei gambiense DAL972]
MKKRVSITYLKRCPYVYFLCLFFSALSSRHIQLNQERILAAKSIISSFSFKCKVIIIIIDSAATRKAVNTQRMFFILVVSSTICEIPQVCVDIADLKTYIILSVLFFNIEL